MEPLSIAYSPCPNDTYLFFAWQKGIVGKSLPIDAHLHDIQALNAYVKEGRYPVSKVSAITALQCQDKYTILPVGAAMGYGCGPLLVAKRDYSLDELKGLKVAIPGEDTVAHLLLNAFLPQLKDKVFCTYDKVLDLIESDEVDCGLIIHETRFSYIEKGFQLVSDLGDIWESRYKLPLPLGLLVAKNDLGPEKIDEIMHILRASIRFSYECPEKAMEYILKHSQEKEIDIVQDHIQLYVNEESMAISPKGYEALEQLQKLSTHATSLCYR